MVHFVLCLHEFTLLICTLNILWLFDKYQLVTLYRILHSLLLSPYSTWSTTHPTLLILHLLLLSLYTAGVKRSDADAVSCMRICRAGDEVVLSTSKGAVIRQKIDELGIQSRMTTGFLIQRISKDDKITMVDIVPFGTNPSSTATETPNTILNEGVLVKSEGNLLPLVVPVPPSDGEKLVHTQNSGNSRSRKAQHKQTV